MARRITSGLPRRTGAGAGSPPTTPVSSTGISMPPKVPRRTLEVLAGWAFQQVRQWLAAPVTGPLLTAGSGLFDGEGRPLVVRLEVPLSAGEMVAALYGEHERLTQADLSTDQDVWRYVALVVAPDGMHAIEQLADVIAEQERCRSLVAPEWLAWCRRRVAEVAARGVPISASRVRLRIGAGNRGDGVTAWVGEQ